MRSTIVRLRRRSTEESGFTLIELLIVLVIIGILLAIAVPSYVGFQERARANVAKSNIRAAVPAVESFYADQGSYTLMDVPSLKLIDAAVKVAVISAAGTMYCISSSSGGTTYYKNGPAGEITATACV